MTVEYWDADMAVVFGPIDEDLEGTCTSDRYGVTLAEEMHGEPLDVALAQEEPDVAMPDQDTDEQWALVEGIDEFGPSAGGRFDQSPEEMALHVVEP